LCGLCSLCRLIGESLDSSPHFGGAYGAESVIGMDLQALQQVVVQCHLNLRAKVMIDIAFQISRYLERQQVWYTTRTPHLDLERVWQWKKLDRTAGQVDAPSLSCGDLLQDHNDSIYLLLPSMASQHRERPSSSSDSPFLFIHKRIARGSSEARRFGTT
jgi:hypothetical protein